MEKLNIENEKLFSIIKTRVESRKDINSENRKNKVNGLTGNKIFQKTYQKYLNGVSFNDALEIIGNDLDSYFLWLDNYPIEMLLISKKDSGYKKLMRYFFKSIYQESTEFEIRGETYKVRGTDFYLNKYK